jgi:hypothetical protein
MDRLLDLWSDYVLCMVKKWWTDDHATASRKNTGNRITFSRWKNENNLAQFEFSKLLLKTSLNMTYLCNLKLPILHLKMPNLSFYVQFWLND